MHKSVILAHLLKAPFFFFCKVGPNWDPRTQACWPITPYLSFKFIGVFLGVLPPYRGPWSRSASSLICSGSILAKPKFCILTFSNTGHSHRMCTDVFFSAPHLLHEGVFALLIFAACTADWYARIGALPTFCNVSYPVYLWTKHTYQLVPPDTVGYLAYKIVESPNFCTNIQMLHIGMII